MRKRRTVCLAALVTAVLGTWVALRLWPRPAAPAPRLPTPDEVDRITARCLPFQGVLPGTLEFSVPPEYVGAILRVLGPPQPDEDLSRFSDELAVLRIACRDGREVVVRLYFYGKEPARYSVDGIHCVRGGAYVGDTGLPLVGGSPRYLDESNVIASVLRLMERQPLDEQARSDVRKWLDRLDRSAGRSESARGGFTHARRRGGA